MQRSDNALLSSGFFHEQSRDDRDRFVEVKWENILDGKSTVLRPTFSVCWTVSKKVKRILHGLKQVQRLSYDRKNMVEASYSTYDY